MHELDEPPPEGSFARLCSVRSNTNETCPHPYFSSHYLQIIPDCALTTEQIVMSSTEVHQGPSSTLMSGDLKPHPSPPSPMLRPPVEQDRVTSRPIEGRADPSRPSANDLDTISTLDLPEPSILAQLKSSRLPTGNSKIINTITSFSDTMQTPSLLLPPSRDLLVGRRGDDGSRTVRPRSVADRDGVMRPSLVSLQSGTTTIRPGHHGLIATPKSLAHEELSHAARQSPPRIVPSRMKPLNVEDRGGFGEMGAFDRLSLSFANALKPSSLATTVRPSSHVRHLDDYEAVLDRLGSSLEARFQQGSVQKSSLFRSPLKVDELEVEWCYFCSKESRRDEMRLMDLDGEVDGREGVRGMGMQWVCKDGCRD